jgi:hypothetical protein
MSLKPGDSLALQFTTRRADTGAATAADSTPTATLVHNGVDDGSVTLTVANPSGAIYKITGTIPSGYAKGDLVQVRVAATVNSVSDSEIVASYVLDSKRVGDLNDIAAGSQMDLVNAPNAAAITAMNSGLATGVEITALQAHGDGAWATATGFALAGSAPGWYTAPDNSDIANLVAAVGSSLGSHVSSILTIVGTSGVVVGSYASGQAPPAAAAISTALLQDTTAGDFTVSGSLGSLFVASMTSSGVLVAPSGLDNISTVEPAPPTSGWNFRQMLLALFARGFRKNTVPDSGNGNWTTYQADGATVMATQAVTDNGTTQTQGAA